MAKSDIDQKRSHPLVDRYVTSDIPLQSLIQNTATVPSPGADALLALEQSLEGKRLARDAIELAQGIRREGNCTNKYYSHTAIKS